MSKRGVLRMIVVLAVVFAVLWGSSPGFADHGGPNHIVCAYFYYEYPPGSEPEYLFDECRVGTPADLSLSIDDGGCDVYGIIRVCYWYLVSIDT